MMNRIVIRKMNQADCEAVYLIDQACFGVNAWKKEEFEKSLAFKDQHFFVAEIDACVVGMASIYTMIDVADLMTIAVLPEYRKMGVAKALMNELNTFCVENRINNLTLEVRNSNAAAIGLYESDGFLRISMRKGYYSNPIEDAIIMQKQFDLTEN